jgi:hypothetical protein
MAGRARDAGSLDAVFRTLGSTGDVAQVLRDFLEHARQVTSAEGLSLLLYDHERDELVFAATETLEENALVCHETPLPPAVASLMSPGRLIVPIRADDAVLGTIDLRDRYDGRRGRTSSGLPTTPMRCNRSSPASPPRRLAGMQRSSSTIGNAASSPFASRTRSVTG